MEPNSVPSETNTICVLINGNLDRNVKIRFVKTEPEDDTNISPIIPKGKGEDLIMSLFKSIHPLLFRSIHPPR